MIRLLNLFICKMFHWRLTKVRWSRGYSNRSVVVSYLCLTCHRTWEKDYAP